MAARLIKPFILLMLVTSMAGLAAFGRRENPGMQTIQVSGRVRMVGSSPMTSLVLSGEDREWHIDENDKEKLMPYQQQIITVRGKEYYRDLTFANGRSAGRWYYLTDISIIQTASEN